MLFCLILSCESYKTSVVSDIASNEIIIAFGSCNKQFVNNVLWNEIKKNNPLVWIWGGDNIYSDTDNMLKMKQDYQQQLNQTDYKNFINNTKVLGTWDDHDYGLNDCGEDFHAKRESQQLFLDFFGVPKNDKRRKQKGIYHSEIIKSNEGNIKIIILDTRYFRTALTPSEEPNKRYKPNVDEQGTILGDTQWEWLEKELSTSKTDFNLIVSSIQFLANEHGYEAWGNMPHEVERMKTLISTSNAKGVLILSGDRHISEFSKVNIDGLNYPLIDFTSSGLTHSYNSFKGEQNSFREGNVVSDLSFGLLKLNFKTRSIKMQMRGKNNELQQELLQSY